MTIRKLVQKLFPLVPPDFIHHRTEFVQRARFMSLHRARMFAVIVAILQLPLLYLDFLNRQAGLWRNASGYRALFLMHAIIAICFSGYALLTFIRKPASHAHTNAWHGFLVLLFACIGLFLPASVSIVDQTIHGQITVFAIAAFWVSAALSLGHISSFVLYSLACAFLLEGINVVQNDPHVLRGHLINAPLLTVLAWVLSRVFFASRIREFIDGKIIEHQKDALEGETFRLQEAVDKATASLRESEEVFRTLAETTAASIFIHQGGKFVSVNSAAIASSGYSRDELLAMNFWDLVHPEYRNRVRTIGLARLQGKEQPQRYELKIITKDGRERWVYMTAGIIEYRGQPSVLGTAFDITDLKRAENEKTRFYTESVLHYQARIEEERRHAVEKENLLKDLHDGIGGITTNINLLAELALKSASPEQVKQSIETIAKLSHECLFEIRGFIQSLDSREMSWNMVAAELNHLGCSMIEPHGIRFALTTNVGDGEYHPGGVVYMNMLRIYKESLSNIIKHAQAKSVTVDFMANGERMVLAVSDDGIGMNSARGTGRGLASMTARAAAIGGSLRVSSLQGVCITLDILFPNTAKPM